MISGIAWTVNLRPVKDGFLIFFLTFHAQESIRLLVFTLHEQEITNCVQRKDGTSVKDVTRNVRLQHEFRSND